MDLFFRGLLIGISIAAPVGPIGVICIRQSLLNGWKIGLSAGLGAACADGFYAIVAVLGLAALTRFFAAITLPLHVGGGLLLLYIAFKIFRSRTSENSFDRESDQVEERTNSPSKTLLQTFALTITNPMTILSFSAILSAFGVERLSLDALYVVSGVFLGSALWWLTLSAGVARFSRWLTPGGMTFINCCSGAIIAGFGLWSILSLRL
ncbi:MAG TPA: LysE family transporter [Drouetiella sp.]|jgi:threonine/homoserine/homoserine lactone efflux protein